MAAKWNMIVDISGCDNCRNCFLATKDEHIGNDFPGYAASQPEHGHSWIDIQRKERGSYPIVEAHFMPVMCNHCDDAPCMKAAKNGAISKRADGIVIIDPEKSKGQKAIVDACPYGAVYWNEEKQIPQAWIFDAHLLDRWLDANPGGAKLSDGRVQIGQGRRSGNAANKRGRGAGSLAAGARD